MAELTQPEDLVDDNGFTCPESFGELQTVTRETPAAVVILIVFFLICVIAGVILMISELDILNRGSAAGDAKEVEVQQIQLGDSDPQLTQTQQSGNTTLDSQDQMEAAPNVANVGNVQSDQPSQDLALNKTDTQTGEQIATTGTGGIDAQIEDLKQQIEQIRMSGSGLSGIFKLPDDVNTVVYVLDRSGSMTHSTMNSNSALDSVKAEVIAALNHMQDKDKKFFIFFYDDLLHPLGSTLGTTGSGIPQNYQLRKSTPKNLKLAENWVQTVGAGGGTNPVPAMLSAIKMQPDLIVLLSDGYFDVQMAEAIIQNNKQNRDGKKINCVGISEFVIPTLLKIAQETGGQYYQAR